MKDELELSETQKNRMAQVQEAAKYYTEEDWDSVRAKLEANRDLSSKVLSIDFSSDDFAKKMVELINEKKRLYKEQRERDIEDTNLTQLSKGQVHVEYLKAKCAREVGFKKIKGYTDVRDVTKMMKRFAENKPKYARSDTEEGCRNLTWMKEWMNLL
ncbi:hypothetical protein Tco_0505274 [Tanacetum coccineum]